MSLKTFVWYVLLKIFILNILLLKTFIYKKSCREIFTFVNLNLSEYRNESNFFKKTFIQYKCVIKDTCLKYIC